MPNKKTHSLTIYLIKESYIDKEHIVKEGLTEEEIRDVGILFYKTSHSHDPSWMKLFANHNIEGLFTASASALLLVKTGDRFFAIPFGPAGRHFLESGVWEERFGMIVTLNSVEEYSIRSIDTKTLESEGIQTRFQSAMPVSADNFGIDVEKDLVKSVTGESKDIDKFGKVLVGKDSLRASLKCDLSDLDFYLQNFLEQFGKDDYKEEFPWIDALKEVNDVIKIKELNKKLIEEINKENPNKLWLTVPDILDWTDHAGYKYSRKEDDQTLDDMHIDTFKEHLNKDIVDINDLFNNRVNRFSQSNEYLKDSWKIYECVYFEYSEGRETYFLTGGKWYAVNNSLVSTVNSYYAAISVNSYGLNFVDYNHADEGRYNEALALANDALLIDKNLIQIEGRSKFEFCDVYTKDKKIIHIKRYSRSSVLSHLFNQGLVSAQFLLDEEFRKKINDKLEDDFKIENVTFRPNIRNNEYTVIFGIISKSERSFDIPFFSKLSLMHVDKTLKNLGFNVSLVKIKNVKPNIVDNSE